MVATMIVAALTLAAMPSALPGGGVAAISPGFHAVAEITDDRSHGVLGDGLLSLNEAIQLHNGTLLWHQLSPGEQAAVQLIPGTGSSLAIAWIDIDGSSIPTITIERDLDPILDTSYGLLIRGKNDPPILDFSGPGLQHGLRVLSNSVSLKLLVFAGGPYGVDAVQTDVLGNAGLALEQVRFTDQAQFAVRVVANTAAGIGRLILGDCHFADCVEALRWEERGADRLSIVELRGVTIERVALGCQFLLGPGGNARYTLDRLQVQAQATAVAIDRLPGGNRSLLVESTHLFAAAPTALRLTGDSQVLCWLEARMWDLVAPSGTALQLGGGSASLAGSLEDFHLTGDLRIAIGGSSLPLELHNGRLQSGAVDLATSGQQALRIHSTRFDACTVQVAGTGAVDCNEACFVQSSLQGTAQAPVVVTTSHLLQPGAHVTASSPRPLPQLGSLAPVPPLVPVGSVVTLQADLPPGLLGLMVLGFTDPAPQLLPRPFHVYSLPGATVTLPGLYRLQQAYAWPLPNAPWFAGFDFTAQLIAVPDPGVSAPAVQLPPGRRFVLR
jgi:hypothetical protein